MGTKIVYILVAFKTISLHLFVYTYATHMSHTSTHLTQHTQTITQSTHTQNHIHIQSHTERHAYYTLMSPSHTQKHTHTCHMAHVEDSLQGLVFSFLLTSRN